MYLFYNHTLPYSAFYLGLEINTICIYKYKMRVGVSSASDEWIAEQWVCSYRTTSFLDNASKFYLARHTVTNKLEHDTYSCTLQIAALDKK